MEAALVGISCRTDAVSPGFTADRRERKVALSITLECKAYGSVAEATFTVVEDDRTGGHRTSV